MEIEKGRSPGFIALAVLATALSSCTGAGSGSPAGSTSAGPVPGEPASGSTLLSVQLLGDAAGTITASGVTTTTAPTSGHAAAAAIVSRAMARASAARGRSSSAPLSRVLPAAASLTGMTITQRPGTRPP